MPCNCAGSGIPTSTITLVYGWSLAARARAQFSERWAWPRGWGAVGNAPGMAGCRRMAS